MQATSLRYNSETYLTEVMDRFEVTSTIARHTMNTFGLSTWVFKFDRAKARCGYCNFATKTISLSKYYVSNPDVTQESLKNTILHEVAHALAGWQAGHGLQWQQVCKSIGLNNPTRLCDFPTAAQPKWLITCKCNPRGTYRYRLTTRIKTHQQKCHKCQYPIACQQLIS